MKLRHKEIDGEIPTSSTADIAFLLVIFFMLTVTFSASQGLDMSVPGDDKRVIEVDPIDSVLVEIQPDAQLMVDGRPLELAQLLGYLAPKLEQNPSKPVIIRPHAEAPYGAMVRVYDRLRQGKAVLNLTQEIQIALPTKTEVSRFWY
ncbi:MAG: biopolymer transporter ExbD [bacterium]|nr:biopolymer transporter ExbD [bacterium]